MSQCVPLLSSACLEQYSRCQAVPTAFLHLVDFGVAHMRCKQAQFVSSVSFFIVFFCGPRSVSVVLQIGGQSVVSYPATSVQVGLQ